MLSQQISLQLVLEFPLPAVFSKVFLDLPLYLLPQHLLLNLLLFHLLFFHLLQQFPLKFLLPFLLLLLPLLLLTLNTVSAWVHLM